MTLEAASLNPRLRAVRQSKLAIRHAPRLGMDMFAGSDSAGRAAEKLDRRWLAFEKDPTYLAASAFRFVDELAVGDLTTLST